MSYLNIAAGISNCEGCELGSLRNMAVPGRGHVDANIMLLAEAPGKDEDMKGLPLIGKAGRHLDNLIEKAGLSDYDLWFDNVIHCRPPDNDLRPYPNAVITCPDLWLGKTLAIINPTVIVTLGATASARWFSNRPMREVAGLARALDGGRTIVGAYHPSYGLRMGSWVDDSIVESLRRAKGIDEEA